MRCKARVVVSLLSLTMLLLASGQTPLQADESYADQRRRLESMSAEEKEHLQRKKERFESLTPAEQSRLRQLHAEIASTPESDKLLAVMARYNEWLKTLSSAVRAELLSLPPDKRIERIKQIKQEQERQRFREFANNLPERDMNVVYAWLEGFVVRNQEELLKRVPPQYRQRMDDQSEAEQRKALVAGFLWRRWEDDSPKPTEADVAELLPQLSDETRRELARATNKEENQQALRTLIRAVVLSKTVPPITDEQRQQVFARLSSVERERLEQMGPDMLRRELTRMYYAQQFRDRDRDGWRGGGPPGGGGPRFGPGRREGDRGERGERPERQNSGPPPGPRPGPPRRSPPEAAGDAENLEPGEGAK